MGQEAIRGPEPGRQTLWDWRAAGNFSFGGTGTSLFVFAALAGLRNPDWLRLAGLPALVLVGAGLGCVGLEIGRPFRSLNVFFRVRSSWMSREAWAAAALFVLGAPAAVFELAWLAVAAAVLSLAMLYTQARMLQAAKGIPAWRVPAVVPLMLVTGLCEGMAALGVAAAVLERRAAAVAAGLAVLLALRLWAWRNYRRALGEAGAPRGAVASLDALQRSFVIAGHLLAWLLLATWLLAPEAARAPVLLIACLAALLAGWYLKFVLVTRAGYDQGFALQRMPARTPHLSPAGSVKPGW